MKNVILILFIFLLSCKTKIVDNQLHKNSNSEEKAESDSFYKIRKSHEDDMLYLIESPQNNDDYNGSYYAVQLSDFNQDGKNDLFINLRMCGSGGCVYGLFLNQYEDKYKLVFDDYLNNVLFKQNDMGKWKIYSLSEMSPNDPSKISISIYQYNDEKNTLELDSSFIKTNEETNKWIEDDALFE